MRVYLEISISANENLRELLISTMIELGCHGFQEKDDTLLCYIERSNWIDVKTASFKNELKKVLQTISANAAISFRDIPEENWNEQWEQTIHPIEIGKRIVIKPSWASYENRNNKIVIQIDPKMSFGTGYHETTRLMLRLMEEYLQQGGTVLDIGTGTGILAIAAIKLGARSAVGIDIDEWSIENAKENIILNEVKDNISISNDPLHKLSSHAFDLITANLTLNTNIDLLPEFYRLLSPTGRLLLSGMLQHDSDTILSQLSTHLFSPIELVNENEWIAIAARRAQ